MRTSSLAILACSPFALLPAQVVRGGDILVTNASSPAAVYRIDTAGNFQTLYSGAPLSSAVGITVARNRDVLVLDFNSSSLFRIDAQTGGLTTVATGLGGPLRVAELLDGDFAVTSNTSRSVLRVTPAGVVTTLAGSPMNRPFGVAVDLTGDLLVADDIGRAVYRVTPAGVVSRLAQGGALRLPQGVAVFPSGDYAVIDGLADAVFRIDRSTNLVSTWVSAGALGVNPEGLVTDWSGGFFIAHSGSPGGNGVRVVDEFGAAAPLSVLSPTWTNLEDVVRVPLLSGPHTLSTGPGAQFTFSLDAPAAAGQYYSLILSGSTHPGWPFLGSGSRAMFLNLDPFFFATIGQNAPPITVGWSGFLPPNGTATATFDLALLPPGALSGLELYQQGLTLNGLTIDLATNVLRLRF